MYIVWVKFDHLHIWDFDELFQENFVLNPQVAGNVCQFAFAGTLTHLGEHLRNFWFGQHCWIFEQNSDFFYSGSTDHEQN
jgi:hypothetical protein